MRQQVNRNLTPADYKIISERIYNRRKKAASGRADRDFSGGQVGPAKTADAVAEELGESRETIKRNGQRAELHDALLNVGDEEAAEID